MKARLGLAIILLLMMATMSYGQGGVDPYTFVQLMHPCAGPAYLPDGLPIYIYHDVDSDGPDNTDPLVTLCEHPDNNCDSGPSGTFDRQSFTLNGAGLLGLPGAFYLEGNINIFGADLSPNRLFLRVFYPSISWWTTKYTSSVFQMGTAGGQIEREITTWDCQDIACCLCLDPDSLFMPNPVEPLGHQPVCAMFCALTAPVIRLFIGPFPAACVDRNRDALVLLNITPGCEGNPESGVSAYYDPPDRGQWVMRGGQPYIQVNLHAQFAAGQTRGCATIDPDYLLSGGDMDCWLPVEMGDVTVTPRDAAVDISWNTRSESGLAHFEILRDHAAIATQPAVNTPAGAEYQYTDRGVDNGHAYAYELVVVNADGSRQTVYTISDIVPSADKAVVTEYALHTNYPNPFNPATTITYDLMDAGDVSLVVFNLMGQKVAELARGFQAAGRHTVSFDGTRLPSGVYVYQLRAGEFVAEQKMLLMK